MKTALKLILIISGALVLLCASVFVINLGAHGWDFRKITDASANYVKKNLDEELAAPQGGSGLTVSTGSMSVTVEKSPDGLLHVSYYDTEKVFFEISNTAEGLSVIQRDNRRWFEYLTFNFSFFSPVLTVQLPDDFEGGIKIGVGNGDINLTGFELDGDVKLDAGNGTLRVSELSCAKLTVKTDNGNVTAKNITASAIGSETDNGNIKFENALAPGKSGFKTGNGYITLTDCTLTAGVTATTGNDNIKITALASNDIRLETGNGSIRGTIKGGELDYKTTVSAGNGDCNLRNRANGEVEGMYLYVKTGNGDIAIDFVK